MTSLLDDYVPTTWVTKRWMGAPVPVPQAASSGLSRQTKQQRALGSAIVGQFADNSPVITISRVKRFECVHIVGGTAKA
jgi:hypothetical protein